MYQGPYDFGGSIRQTVESLEADIATFVSELADPDTHPEDRQSYREELFICRRELARLRQEPSAE